MKREQSKIEKDVLESMKDKIVDLLNHTDNELKAKGISNRAPIYIGYGIGETISRSGIVNENVSLSNFQIMDFILGIIQGYTSDIYSSIRTENIEKIVKRKKENN